MRAASTRGTIWPLTCLGHCMGRWGFSSKYSRSSSRRVTTWVTVSTTSRTVEALEMGGRGKPKTRWMNDDLPTPVAPMTATLKLSIVGGDCGSVCEVRSATGVTYIPCVHSSCGLVLICVATPGPSMPAMIVGPPGAIQFARYKAPKQRSIAVISMDALWQPRKLMGLFMSM